MTKMKSKKMTKSTFAIIIMAIAMVAMLAFGGTYAYFTATTTPATGNVQTGKVMLNNSGLTVVAEGTEVVPGMKLTTAPVTIKNNSNVSTWIFVTISTKIYKKGTGSEYNVELTSDDYTGTGVDAETVVTIKSDSQSPFKTVETDAETLADLPKNVYAYKADGVDAETALAFAEYVMLNSAITSNSSNTNLGPLMDVKIEVTLTAESVQAFKDYGGTDGAARDMSALEAYKVLHTDYTPGA